MASMIPWGGGGGGRSVWDPFSWDVWDPFDIARGRWDLGSGSGGGRSGDDTLALARANVDWRETSDAHIFSADIPGLRKEDVKVQVEDGNILRMSGEKVKEEVQAGDTWHRVERRSGGFSRRFRLPENANADLIRCHIEHGVLTVVVPKKVPAAGVTSPDVRNIEIGDAPLLSAAAGGGGGV